jgi:hypothetical protein
MKAKNHESDMTQPAPWKAQTRTFLSLAQHMEASAKASSQLCSRKRREEDWLISDRVMLIGRQQISGMQIRRPTPGAYRLASLQHVSSKEKSLALPPLASRQDAQPAAVRFFPVNSSAYRRFDPAPARGGGHVALRGLQQLLHRYILQKEALICYIWIWLMQRMHVYCFRSVCWCLVSLARINQDTASQPLPLVSCDLSTINLFLFYSFQLCIFVFMFIGSSFINS